MRAERIEAKSVRVRQAREFRGTAPVLQAQAAFPDRSSCHGGYPMPLELMGWVMRRTVPRLPS